MTSQDIRPMLGNWRTSMIVLVGCIVWILFLYSDTAIGMVAIWARSETFAHAFLVPPISLWLIWRKRHVLAGLTPQVCLPMVGLLALAGFAWLIGDLAAINAVSQFALVSLVVLAVPTILGLRLAQVMLFPLAYLFFAVPIGEFVIPQFMQWTADFTVLALRATGIPVFREGQNFVIPSGPWAVVEACSGVRYLIASVVVGTLYAYLSYRSLQKRLIFVGVSLIVPIVANWVRAYIIVMLGHLSGNKLAVGVDHLIYGWVFFGVVMILMYIIGARWAENPDPNETVALGHEYPVSSQSRYGPWLAAAVVALVTALPQIWNRETVPADVASSPVLHLRAIEGWEAAASPDPGWRPAFGGSSSELRSVLRQGDRDVGLFVAYYRRQTYERKLVSSSNVLVKSNDSDWVLVASGTREILLSGRPLKVRTAELRGRDGRRLEVWQWYWINGRLTSSDYIAKAYTALTRLLGEGDDSAVVVVFAPQGETDGGGEALLRFVGGAGTAIDAVLREARDTK